VDTAEQTSTLPADAGEVWGRAVTAAGINDELRPILRMTMPASLRDKTIDHVTVGEPLGRSWILLGGVIPVDFDDLCLVELEPGRRFLERSRTLAFSLWEHERTVEAAGPGACRVSDRLSFELRRGLAWVPGGARLARAIVAALFRHRHRRLRRRYG
jgi:ligand-binding SRPBCC domain-containing protein